MKLREDVQKNRVWNHGSMYVDHNEFVPICPECCSDKITKVPEGQTGAIYTCTDCGCEFDAWKESVQTKLGKTVHRIIVVLMVILVIMGVGFCIFGAVWIKKKKTELGSNVDGTIILKSLGFSLGIPLLCMIAEGILLKIDDKIC